MRALSYKGRSIQKGPFFFLKKNNTRVIQIGSYLLHKSILIYNGLREKRFVFKKKHLYTKCGQYLYTKRMSFKIHVKLKKKKKKFK